MYDLRLGTLEEYNAIIPYMTECGKPEPVTEADLTQYDFIEIVSCDGVDIAGFLIKPIAKEACFCCCVFRKGLEKHVRFIKKVIEGFFEATEFKEVYAECRVRWTKGNRFMKFMGMEPQKKVEIDPRDGVKYRLYRRSF